MTSESSNGIKQDLTAYWQRFDTFVDDKTLRERVILLLVAVVLVYGLMDLLFLGGLLTGSSAQSKQLQAIMQKNHATETQIAQLVDSLQDSQRNANEEIEALRQKLAGVDQQLTSAAGGFVPANVMPRVLEEVLESGNKLVLMRLENKPVEIVAGSGEDDAVKLYRHGVEMQLQGSYLAVLEYLQALEKMNWRFQWDAMAFAVGEYPLGVLTLEVYTFSTEKDWIGV